MNTVGKFIADARRKKKISLSRLSQKTKIKERFLAAIEKEEWQVLPNYTVTAGFVRNIAISVGINPDTALAFLRRDFAAEEQIVLEKRVFYWSPKLTTALLILIMGGGVAIYLLSQYLSFVKPPPLNINAVERKGSEVEISGKTDKVAGVLINDESILTHEDGSFKVTISAQSGEKLIVESRSRSGKSTKKEIIVP